MNYFKVLFAVVKKDLLIETRVKEVVNAALVFAILMVVVFSFTLEKGVGLEEKLSAGIFWISVAFAGILSLNKTMALETEGGNFNALMLAPVDKSAIFFGKVISNMIFLLFIELILIPLMLVFYNVLIINHPLMIAVIILCTYAFSLIGTLFAIISVNTNSKEIMLPVLLLPFMVPVLISAIISTNIFITESPVYYSFSWLKLTAVFNIIFTAIIYGLFSWVIEE